jgi:hypothetical protein
MLVWTHLLQLLRALPRFLSAEITSVVLVVVVAVPAVPP